MYWSSDGDPVDWVPALVCEIYWFFYSSVLRLLGAFGPLIVGINIEGLGAF